MKKTFYGIVLGYGLVLSAIFGGWSLVDFAMLTDAYNKKAETAELRHRINVFAEGTWFLLSNIIVIAAVNGLSSDKKSKENT